MKNRKNFFYKDFFEIKEDAVRAFFQYARDHKCAAQELILTENRINYIDSAGYLYHHAYEILLKAVHLYYFDEFKKTHNLQELYKKVQLFIPLSNDDMNLLIILNSFQELKYPIEKKIRKQFTTLIKDRPYLHGEIADEDFTQAAILFEKIWKSLEQDENIYQIFEKIDWTKKGGRLVMRKPIK
jgi:HEPN domain-containing protein